MGHVGIIGGGVTGLAAALSLSKNRFSGYGILRVIRPLCRPA